MKDVGDELIVSAEIEEETKELESVELEDEGTGGSRMKTIGSLLNIVKCVIDI